jgi:hypothetical protein
MTTEEFVKYIQSNNELIKRAFVSSADVNKQAGAMPPAGGPPPMDPNAMPPPPPGDPNAMPPPPPGDPSMGGQPPAPEGPSPDEIVDLLDTMSQGMQQFEGDVNALKQEVQQLRVQLAESMGTMKTIMDILNKGSASAPKAAMPSPAAPMM